MTRPSERLLDLLPGIYRGKDATLDGQPLAAWLRALGVELDALDEAIGQLLDDHFVERASAEALPLLADLLGARLLDGDPGKSRGVLARAVAWRRRKGTLATLQETLAVTTGWAAEVDEGFRSLVIVQDINHVLPARGLTADVRDPIAMADPLSRRAAEPVGASGLLDVGRNEALDEALRRIGRADAGRYAASPRTIDLRGWARPDAVIVRTARLVPVELEELTPSEPTTLADGRRVVALDPLGRDAPIVWLEPTERPDLTGGLTAAHEPETSPPERSRVAASLLVPTALAADPDRVEAAGALKLSIEGILLVGPDPVPVPSAPLAAEPVGPTPVLRLADPSRPSGGDRWKLELLAARDDDERVLLSTDAEPGVIADPVESAASQLELQGAAVALRVTRVEGRGALRDAASAVWSPLVTTSADTPRSGAAAVTFDGKSWIARAQGEAAGATMRVGLLDPAVGGWTTITPAGALPARAVRAGAASAGDRLFLIGPDDLGSLGVWEVMFSAGPSATSTRLDDPDAPPRPPARIAPSVCVEGDDIFVFGGVRDGTPIGDVWVFSRATGAWKPYLVRNRKAREGAVLLRASGALVLLGGQSVPGELDPTVWRCDLSKPRPAWSALPALPIAAGRPGSVVARTLAGGDIEALVWADHTRPLRFLLIAGAKAWTPSSLPTSALEAAAPNPPSPGDATFVNGDLAVVTPPPLPPSEVMFSLGGRGRLAFLPALDFAPGASAIFEVLTDGSTRRTGPDDASAYPHGPYASSVARDADVLRLNVPGRLGRHRFVLRQRILGAAIEGSLVADAPDVVGLDPRLGRVILPALAPPGRITASFRVGRGASIGAGLLPRDRAVPAYWLDQGEEAPTPPDLERPGAPVSAWVHPDLAGTTVRRAGVAVPVHATLEAALAASAGADPPVLGAVGSAHLPAARLASRAPRGLSIIAADFGAVPFITTDPLDPAAPSLGIHPFYGGGDDTEVWLAGLWLAGRLDLVMARGRVDLRFCTLGQPSATAVRVAGADHAGPTRRSLHDVEVELRMYGCIVGPVELPPWVRLTAAGCTFDAGSSSATAIRAPGARVRLRHCTVRGAVHAGTLEASSCAFAGEVRVDRRDLGWVRYSLLPPGGGPPRLYRSLHHPVAFASVRALDPTYLVLAESNGAALSAGELGRVPGAHAERTGREEELRVRTELDLPVALNAHHLDRTTLDLARMRRSPT